MTKCLWLFTSDVLRSSHCHFPTAAVGLCRRIVFLEQSQHLNSTTDTTAVALLIQEYIKHHPQQPSCRPTEQMAPVVDVAIKEAEESVVDITGGTMAVAEEEGDVTITTTEEGTNHVGRTTTLLLIFLRMTITYRLILLLVLRRVHNVGTHFALIVIRLVWWQVVLLQQTEALDLLRIHRRKVPRQQQLV